MVMLCATFIALHGWGNIHSIVIAFIVLMAVVLGCASVAARWLLGRRSKLVDAGLARIIAEDRLQLQIEPLAEGETNAKDRAVVVMVQSEIAVVEVTNRLADAAEKSGTFTRSSSARHRAALRAAGDVRMPPHVEMALRSSRLTLSNARYQKIRTLTLDYLVWAVDQADDELVDLFWKRAQKPVFAAILVFALAESLAQHESRGRAAERIRTIGTVYKGKRIRDLLRIAQRYHLRARRMVAQSKSHAHARWLGRCWGVLRPQVVYIAFAPEEITQDELDSEPDGVSQDIASHPALKHNIDSIWSSDDDTADGISDTLPQIWDHLMGRSQHTSPQVHFMLDVCSHIMFLLLHAGVLVITVRQRSDETANSFLAKCTMTAFWTIVFALTLDHVVVTLVENNRGMRRSDSFHKWWSGVDFLTLSLCYVAQILMFVAPLVPDAELSNVIKQGATQALALAFAPSFLRLLDYLSMLTEVGTVVNLIVEIFLSQEHLALVCIMLVLSLGCGFSINQLHLLHSDEAAPDDVSVLGIFHDMVATEISLLNMAIDMGVESDGLEANSSAERLYIYFFLFVANMYLVEGFLIGIINHAFGDRSKVENRALLWKLSKIRRYAYSSTPVPAPFNIYWNLQRIHASGVCETYGLLERWEANELCRSMQRASVPAPGDSAASSKPVSSSAKKSPGKTDTAKSRTRTKNALLGGLRSGALEAAVEKMEEDTNEEQDPEVEPDAPVGCSERLLSFWIRFMRFVFVILVAGATLCFGPFTSRFLKKLAFQFRDDPAVTDRDEEDAAQQKDTVLLRTFNEIDKDNDGYLDEEEILAVMRSMGLGRSPGEDVMAQMDADGDGKVTFEEFAMWMDEDDGSHAIEERTVGLMTRSVRSEQLEKSTQDKILSRENSKWSDEGGGTGRARDRDVEKRIAALEAAVRQTNDSVGDALLTLEDRLKTLTQSLLP